MNEVILFIAEIVFQTLEDSRFDGTRIKVEYPKDSFIHSQSSQAPPSVEQRSSQPVPSRNGATRDPETSIGSIESIRNTLAQQVEQQRQQVLSLSSVYISHLRDSSWPNKERI